MAVELLNSALLKPPTLGAAADCTPFVPLTIFDRAAFDLHVPSLYAFLPPTPSNHSLKSGLSRVLHLFPHLAGRMATDDLRRPCILLNNAGVRVIETSVSAALSEMLPLDATSDLSELHSPVGDDVEELLQVQFNRYSCGGLVIGLTSHHRVADGQSMSLFFAAWAQAVRLGEVTGPRPFLDRAAVGVPRNPLRVEFNHREVEFRAPPTSPKSVAPAAVCAVENLKVRFSGDFIEKLKALVPFRCSTFECLLAHLWRKISAARGLDGAATTKVRVAVNGRARMKPAVPMEFFGNLVLWAHPRTTVEELNSTGSGINGLAEAARIIHEAVQSIDDRYFRSFIDFGEAEKAGRKDDDDDDDLVATAPATGNMLCPDLEVDSWLRFNFHDLDFGGGPPCAFLPPNLPVEGLMIFVPSVEEKGGVDVFMALAVEHVGLFKKCCYSLDY
ncbi:Agmatine coumaroyltransferase-2 [Apostasia shenzhenica]|uniref:Agmatine coumaroyltransferase-2 n=1 Tax=Apostasia shenzhenica TaxID=1088818 RepID=A0A2I0ABN4_9ASPA|nr:Agmatine coumaroyltransferase-2 [Apostasia shenzhenica]